MHHFLRSIGFSSVRTKQQLNDLKSWVLADPDHLSVVGLPEDGNVAMAEREVSGHAGIAVIGEMDERGEIQPEYYFPYISTTHISSDAHITCEKQAQRNGFIGMCEDFRMGMALIFTVRNVAEVFKLEQTGLLGDGYKKVCFSALAEDAQILLPLYQPEMALKRASDEEAYRMQLMNDAHNGSEQAMEQLANRDVRMYENLMNRLHETDIFTLVESFFMPHGMESDQYYFLGRIAALQRIRNDYTGEFFYRMLVEANRMVLVVAVNEKDVTGVPEVGRRIRCHAWLLGEVKK